MFPGMRILEALVSEAFFAFEKKNVSELFQKHFVAATNVSCARKRGHIVVSSKRAVANGVNNSECSHFQTLRTF